MEQLSREKQRLETKGDPFPEIILVFFRISSLSSYQDLNAFLALGPVDTMHSYFSLDS